MAIVLNRETVYAALFSKLQGIATSAGIKTVSRHVKHYADVPAAQRPAAYQFQKGETWKRVRNFPPVITLKAEWLLYLNANPTNNLDIASKAINNILDAVEEALAPPISPDNNQTLGLPNIVQHAWIEDGVEIYEGVLLDTSIVIVPIHILCSGGVPA